MRVFKNLEDAAKSYETKNTLYLNSVCPYQKNKLCGNWCALFYFSPAEKRDGRNLSAYVILGCKVDQKMLYVNEVI